MKRAQKPMERERIPGAAAKPEGEAPRLTLRIEELEPRLAPESTVAILD